MAKTPLNQNFNSSGTYTVPAGKYAIFAAHSFTGAARSLLQINGATEGAFTAVGQSLKPFTANAGDVISSGTIIDGPSVTFAISGFLYDQ